MDKNKKKPYKKEYNKDLVKTASNAISESMSIREAATTYSVPGSTLQAKYNNIIPVGAKEGPSTYLTSEEEVLLDNWILYCSERGFPVTKCQLLDSVQEFVLELEKENPFRENRPGRHWYESFHTRHPQMSDRVCQNLRVSRASAIENKLRSWFEEVHNHLHPLNLVNIDGPRIFNLDENAFFLIPKGERVLVRKGSKAIYKVVHGNDKESLTVLFAVSTNGVMLPPMILFWYERIPAAITRSLPAGWIAGTTERRWMTAGC